MKIIANYYKPNELIKTIRLNLNLTQEELSKKVNISKSSLEKYERGKVNYTYDTLLKILNDNNLEIIIKEKKNTNYI